MSLPGQPPRGRAPESGGGAMSASRGGMLIGVAVVVGILIFSVINRGGPSAGTPVVTQPPVTVITTPATNLDGSPAAPVPETTATTKAKKSSSSKTARANDQVVVQVLNGSGVQNAATQRSNDLKAKGYQVLPAGNAPETRTGSVVKCKAGYEKEAEVLASTLLNDLGVPTTTEAVPDPLPAGHDASANCYVLLGK